MIFRKPKKRYWVALFVILFAVINYTYAQEQKTYTNKPRFAGVFFGINESKFYRNDKDKFQGPLSKPHLGFRAGVILDIINRKKFASQLELSFVQKGSDETFFNEYEKEYVSVKSNLNYAQIELFPMILKPLGLEKFNPYLSAGGYYSFLVNGKFQYQFESSFGYGSTYVLDEISLSKTDYGLSIITGINLSGLSLEVRHSFGMNSILADKFLKNQINAVSIKLTR